MTDIVERIRKLTIERGQFTIGYGDYDYSVVTPDFEPRVPNFVGVLGEREYFISSQVPRRFRRPIIAHEVYCFAEKDKGHAGHCVCAVNYELTMVMPEDRAEYLALRRKFFNDLVAFSKDGDPVFLREITASRDYLDALT